MPPGAPVVHKAAAATTPSSTSWCDRLRCHLGAVISSPSTKRGAPCSSCTTDHSSVPVMHVRAHATAWCSRCLRVDRASTFRRGKREAKSRRCNSESCACQIAIWHAGLDPSCDMAFHVESNELGSTRGMGTKDGGLASTSKGRAFRIFALLNLRTSWATRLPHPHFPTKSRT